MTQRYDLYKDSGVQWLGEIPGHWGMSKISSHFRQRNEKVSDKDYPALSVSKQGVTPQLEKVALSNAEGASRKLVKVGDYAVNSRSDRKGSCGVSKYEGSVSLITIVLEPFNIDGEYVHYLFRSNPWVEEFYRNGRGIVADLWTTNYQMMKSMYMPVPPLSEQRSIVSFLDAKCGKIDEWVIKKQKEVEHLQELKQRVIADAVTRGLNLHAKMKATNIPCLKEIPEHWEVLRNKCFLRLTDEKVGNKNDVTLLSLTKQGVIIRDLSEGKGKFPKDFDNYLVVRPNNLVFCLFDMDETPRTVGLVRNYGMLTGAYTNFEVNEKIVLPEYAYCYYLQVDDVKGLRPYYTGLRKVVKTNTFLQLRIPVPPLSEQKQIVSYLDDKISKIDKLIANITKEMEAIKEYKQRLISDVVTGQIKVC